LLRAKCAANAARPTELIPTPQHAHELPPVPQRNHQLLIRQVQQLRGRREHLRGQLLRDLRRRHAQVASATLSLSVAVSALGYLRLVLCGLRGLLGLLGLDFLEGERLDRGHGLVVCHVGAG
jgi:hypothetical protein